MSDSPIGPADRTFEALASLVESPITGASPAPWGTSGRSDLVTTLDGRRLVVQRFDVQPASRNRVNAMVRLPPRLERAGIPVPRLVATRSGHSGTVVITEQVAGRPGASMLAAPDEAVVLGALMGDLVRRLATIPTEGLGIPSTWAHADRLARVATGWLERVRPMLDRPVVNPLAEAIDRLPNLFAGRPSVVAHGDLVPVNLLVDGAAVTAVLDWEFTRLADPLFDAAWWGWIVRFHHPDAFAAAWPALLDAAAVRPDAPSIERMHTLVGVWLLEAVAFERMGQERPVGSVWIDHLRRFAEDPFPG